MKKAFTLSLALLFSFSLFSQEWEFVRTFDSYDSIRPNSMQSLTELSSGDIIVNSSWKNNNLNGSKSENPGRYRSAGKRLASQYRFRDGSQKPLGHDFSLEPN